MDDVQEQAWPAGPHVLVIGLGGGGLQSLTRMVEGAEQVPDLVAVHTETQALANCALPRRIQVGERTTQGLGTGGDPELGQLAAEEDETKLSVLVGQADVVCVVTALGGGTGTGLAPSILSLAREQGAVTLCLATLPFSFEGTERMGVAKNGLQHVLDAADVTIVLPNDRLQDLVGEELSMEQAFQAMDHQMGQAVLSLWRMLNPQGLVNLDFADLRRMAACGGGSCVMAYAEAEGNDRAVTALERLLQHPMLDRGNTLAQARGMLIGITGGEDLRIREVETLMNELRAVTPSDTRIFFGTDVDSAWGDRLGLSVLVSEQWREGAATPIDLPGMDVPRQDVPAVPDDGSVAQVSAAARASGRLKQASLNLESPGKGRFKDVAPTYYEGEDLDVPTFLRRGITLLGEG